MTNPPVQPRDSCQVPALFGKSDFVFWLEPRNDMERRNFQTAYMQHAYCWAIRSKARDKFNSIERYAKATGQKYDRLARVLRGQHVLRLDDIGLAIVVLGDVHEDAREVIGRSPHFVRRNRNDV